MKYKTGMYGGAFDPPHTGHMNCISKAASMCEHLYIVISFSRNRDYIPVEYRYRWLYNSFLHMDNVEIKLIEDKLYSKVEYDTDEYWTQGRNQILDQIGRSVDVVFCGDDYKGTERYEKLYACPVEYFDRKEVPVSSSMIRENPFTYWDQIPLICRPYFVKKVLLIGGESTGKSTLTQNLALTYNTNHVEEIGRNICDYAGGKEELMIEEDFHEILLRHKMAELETRKYSNKLLFIDTDALITKFFARFLLNDQNQIERMDRLADAITAINEYDLILFLEPTVEFVQDGTRNERLLKDRKGYSEQIKRLFDLAGMKYHCLDGNYLERYQKARKIINQTFAL